MDNKGLYSGFASPINDKSTVIFEIGRQFTKCGFAGEPAPRAIIRTVTAYNGRAEIDLQDVSEPKLLRSLLGDFLEKIYFNQLAISPKEKKVVIVESVLCKSSFREALIHVLFDQFNVPSVLFVPDQLMAITTLGRTTGLVLDVGSEEAVAMAVVEGVTLLDGAQFARLGARTIDSSIEREIRRRNPNHTETITSQIIEDIRIRTCFVAPFRRSAAISKIKSKLAQQQQISGDGPEHPDLQSDSSETDELAPADIVYSIDGSRSLKIPGYLREGACELLFEILAHEHSLATMIIDVILSAPIDCRRSLSENILIIGGTASMPGFEHRMYNELLQAHQLRGNRDHSFQYKIHKAICPKNYVAWLGASMFCTASSIELRSTTREQWIRNEKKNLLEWSDLIRSH